VINEHSVEQWHQCGFRDIGIKARLCAVSTAVPDNSQRAGDRCALWRQINRYCAPAGWQRPLGPAARGQREPIALRRSRIARAPACESAGARRRR
jgi:hypothetical protein